MTTAVQGWYNPTTNERGKFNKDGNPVSFNLWDRFCNWVMRLVWAYSYRTTMKNQYEYRGLVTWEDGSNSPCYVNKFTKKAYVWSRCQKWAVDYNALVQDHVALKTGRI